MSDGTPAAPGILERLSLHRRELRAWAMYDWAISAVQTTVMAAVFPIFYIQVAGADVGATKANQWWAISNGLAIAIVAVLSPILGAIADLAAAKKKLLALTTAIGVLGCAGMFFIEPGALTFASMLFVVVTIGAAAAVVFYDSLLPHIASPSEVDRVSAAAFAIGYLGGGLLLAVNLAMIQKPAWFGLRETGGSLPVRLSMVTVALWWLIFSIPLFRRVPEPPRRLEQDEQAGQSAVRVAFGRLLETFHELRSFKHAFLMLVAFLIYNDGISTIQKMATAYGTELGIRRESLIAAILIVQFVGVPATFLFGALARWIGAKRSILAGLVIYLVVSVVAYSMKDAADFYLLAGLVGLVQGGTQALSRSLFATLIPRHKSGEFFGFYSVFSKFAGIFGPLVFAAIIGATGSSRNAILSVSAFFLVGGILLTFVNVEEGARRARAAEATTHEG
ncbi:MAG TPA: MFS transporter [Thermoanaerobaculia bacterium]|nr:MFS transporter [Thermoanaerobaculia bacterium]